MRFLIVDDSASFSELVTFLLRQEGHTVESQTSPSEALYDATRLLPDCILLDLMMPEMDGFELCRRLRQTPALTRTKIIVLSGKSYEFDKRKARLLGADGYIVKPIQHETFIAEINKVLAKKMVLTYWGVRGTLPVPGGGSLKYGGNTSCVTVNIGDEPLIVFDAGSGIKKLSNHLMATGVKRLTAKIFISHPHWDHINALAFFLPLYIPGNEIEILGPAHGDTTTRKIISAQMDDVYFPVTIREFGARVFFRDLREESLDVGNIRIDTLLLSHPGSCLGYRVTYDGKSICYVTDNELFPEGSAWYNNEYEERLAQFVHATDILIADSTYLDEEYPSKVGWGHSCSREVARLADMAGVKSLHLFHHDPDQDDNAIDRKLEQSRRRLRELGSDLVCLCATEGSQFAL